MIRNLALMRNIGKYSLYSEPMFPEVGMAYNIYEHVLNRPDDIGAINGVIGYNNAIVSDDVLLSNGDEPKDRFRYIEYEPTSSAIQEKLRKGKSVDNDTKSDANNLEKTTVRRVVYTTNSGSAQRSGGDIAMGEVLKIINKSYLPENQYMSDAVYSIGNGVSDGFSINRPTFIISKIHTTVDTYDGDSQRVKTYSEGIGFPGEEDISESTIPRMSVEYITREDEYAASGATWGRLLYKTNKLFHEGKINSIISRFYTDSRDTSTFMRRNGEEFMSRGRNLKKKGKKPEGGGYDNPYCRVWTIHNQYNKMTDLIRPRVEDFEANDKEFATIERIQAPYGYGLRPGDGASRLSEMSVLKPNGMVNFAPHKDENGDLVKESIKKCMFSIENLAWKDIQCEKLVTRKYWQDDEDGKGGKFITRTEKLVGGTLSEEQKGPNGGRIMWFPPYNLRFSEDVVTNWNSNTFIGRGENMYTYVNTERGGTLSFTLLIDHPSVVDKWINDNPNVSSYEHEQQLLRFFAGCDELGEVSKGEEDGDQPLEPEPDPVVTPDPAPELREVKAFVFFPNNYSGMDDDVSGPGGLIGVEDTFLDYLCPHNGKQYEDGNGTPIDDKPGESTSDCKTWHYKVDDILSNEKLVKCENYNDRTDFGLNNFTANMDVHTKAKMVFSGFITNEEEYGTNFYSFKDLCDAVTAKTSNTWLWHILNTDQIRNIERIEFRGYASSHGHPDKNQLLAQHRAETIQYLISTKKPEIDNSLFEITTKKVIGLDATNQDVSSLDAKLARSVEVIFYVGQGKELGGKNIEKKPEPEKVTNMAVSRTTIDMTSSNTWDDEYRYFKELKETDSFIKERITEKVKFFDPAFHSITPEGFNARLTFLHQCTRQGPTITIGDTNNATKDTGVGNLAFGRAPYCVLRIGDFYNTKILIESISIQYDTNGGVQWDLNPEGVGVQPMMADIQMRFKFVGGTDISGPIERLQNAVSFNYYSNASIYERRADYRRDPVDRDKRPEDNPVFLWDARTNGTDNKK